MAKAVTIYTDGGSRGNPGPAAAAFVVLDENQNQIYASAEFLGTATNNIAEYTAFLNSIVKAAQLGIENVLVYSDSELMVKQIKGLYKVKNPDIRKVYDKCIKQLKSFDNFSIEHVRRDKNVHADALVNQSLDCQGDIEEVTETIDEPENKNQKPVKLGILLSGGGRSMANIIDHIKVGRLNAEISIVISSRSNIGGVEKATAAGLNLKIIRKKDFADIETFSEAIRQQLVAAEVDLVIQAGWLCLWKIPSEYKNRVMNIHPGLLPSFGGKGMWGHHVHEAVLEAGCKVSGCTVHWCNDEYDKGKILVQRCCAVEDDDTPDTLAGRVFQQECIAYPEAIKKFIETFQG